MTLQSVAGIPPQGACWECVVAGNLIHGGCAPGCESACGMETASSFSVPTESAFDMADFGGLLSFTFDDLRVVQGNLWLKKTTI
jgi:hypothetical protein